MTTRESADGESAEHSIRTPADLGARLREARGLLTQQTVARRSVIGHAALTRQRVSNIENGLLPTAEQLRCYLQGCGQPELAEQLEPARDRLEQQAEAAEEPASPAATGSNGRSGSSLRRLIAFGVTIVGVAAISATTVVLLTDDNSGPECDDRKICFWPEPNYTGDRVMLDPDWSSTTHCHNLGFVARSVQNNSHERQRGYSESNCTGEDPLLEHRGNGPMPSVAILSYRHS